MMDDNLTAAERALGELRADLTGAAPEAMNRMRAAVLTRTVPNPAPVRPGGARPHRLSGRPGRRVLRPATVAVAAAAAAAVGIGTVVVATGDQATPGPANQAAGTESRLTPPPGGTHPTGSPPAPSREPVTTVQQLLGRASLAVDGTPVAPRDDQFIYTRWRSKNRPIGRTDLPERLPTDSTGEHWDSADGSRPNWAVSVDKLGRPDSSPIPANLDPGLRGPTYEFLTTLPTDPDRLLALIRQSRAALVRQGKIEDLDQDVFEAIGILIHQALLPPGLAPALYRAAARLPGVRIVQDTVDAAGRHGIGVFRSSARIAAPGEAYAMMWIFDPQTYEYRGQRMDIGTMSSSLALLQVAIVDRARRRPNGQLAPPASPHRPPRGTPPPPTVTR